MNSQYVPLVIWGLEASFVVLAIVWAYNRDARRMQGAPAAPAQRVHRRDN